MTVMTTPRKKPEPEKRQRTGQSLSLWINDQLADAFKAYLDSTRPRVSKTSALEQALEDFLRSKGFWPFEKGED
jgi:hypothetical protein